MAVNNLPKHWQIKKLAEVADYLNGRAFKPTEWEKTGKPIIRIQNLNKAEAIYNYTGQEFDDRYKVERGELLYAWSASLGVYIWNGDNAWLNQHIFKVVPKNICNKKFLFYSLEKITAELYAKTHGSGMVHVTKGKFEETEIPFPSLLEQTLIVSKIEELLSDLENGKQQLLLAQQQLKVYRQSLLKWAFEGKLTNKNLNGELPKGWKWVKLGTVLDKIEAGKSFKCDERTPKLNEVGVLKVSAVTWKIFNEIESKTVIEKDRINEGYYVKKDDFLFSRANTLDLIGAVVLVNNIERKLMLSDKTLRFIFSSNILKGYMLYYLRSKKGKNEIQRLSTGNQESMRNIGQERIKQIEFPLCSLEEQKHIVDELERKLTVCDKIEETISQSLQQTETLRQSILKKAFEGRLV